MTAATPRLAGDLPANTLNLPQMSAHPQKIAVVGPCGFTGSRVTRELLARGHSVTGISRDPERLRQSLTTGSNYQGISADVSDVPAMERALAGHDVVINCYGPHGTATGPASYKSIVEASRIQISACKKLGIGYFIQMGGAASLHIPVDGGRCMLDTTLRSTVCPDWAFPWFIERLPLHHAEFLRELLGGTAGADNEPGKNMFMGWQLLNANFQGLLPEAKKPMLEVVVSKMKEGGLDLLESCRVLWLIMEHDRTFNWTFISPPWLLSSGPRSGTYQRTVDDMPWDKVTGPLGIYVDDLACAVADEIDSREGKWLHWSASGPQDQQHHSPVYFC